MTAKTLDQSGLALEVARTTPTALPTVTTEAGPNAVLALMAQAVEKGVPVETMQALQAMYHKEQDRSAAREFADAMAQFQATCPPIPKTASSKSTGERSGARFEFTYAPLDTIAATVGPVLHALGLTYSWDTETTEKLLTCSCTLRHRNGHSVVARFSCPMDSSLPIGSQQKAGAALTYARRYSLIQVLGLTTTDPDVEGDTASMEKIGPHQAALLLALIEETGTDAAKLLAWLKVPSVESILTSDYGRAVSALEKKRQSK